MPNDSERFVRFALVDEAATLALGAALAPAAAGGGVLHLSGDLGAGKTTLARGLLRALGWPGAVKSPTYTLVELYELSSLNLYHFDLFRFNDSSEWLSSGLGESLDERSLAVIEWPERAQGLLPPADLLIELALQGSGRSASITAHGMRGLGWLASLRFQHG
jgi:tRNA threonylcarbamoyladenosine biosynthesis protein TsaE